MPTSITPICFAPTVAIDGKYHEQWFLVTPELQCLDQEACKPLAQLTQQRSMGHLQLRAPGMLRLELVLDVLEDDDEVRCRALDSNGVEIAAIDEGELAAVWFSHVLGRPCRLLKKDPGYPDL